MTGVQTCALPICQDKKASIPRKIAMLLCQEFTSETFQELGRFFNRKHSTVIAAIESLKTMMNKDDALARQVKDLRYMLET